MKSRRHCIYALLIWAMLSFGLHKAYSQNYFNLNFGMGIPEMAHISLGFQLDQAQMMFGFGEFPLPGDNLLSIYGDLYIHIWGKSDYSGIKPWYGRGGLKYFREETERWIDQYSYLDIRLGRTLFINEALSVELDLGLAFELTYDREIILPTTSFINLDFPILPSIGARLVYRFGIESK